MRVDLRSRARERLTRERGAITPKKSAMRVALVFPDIYRVGMASLGFQIVYQMLNNLADVSCERAFLPDPDELAEHERTGTELFTLETQTPLSEFDVVAFSISFEMNYLNVLRMIRLANLPMLAKERSERHPIVIAGGICPTFNPEPLVDFVDAFVIGDAEPVLPKLAHALTKSGSREEALVELASIPGTYVPAFPSKVQRAVADCLSSYPGTSPVSTPVAEFGSIKLIEVARGCGRGCRFCVAGHVTRPPRAREHIELSEDQRYGLVGAAVFDHAHAFDLCERIIQRGAGFTVSSLRLETVTSEVARLLVAGGVRTLTIAPEAGSERLRTVIGKSVGESSIFAAISSAESAGIKHVKLYFMVGLPTETDSDVIEIAALVRKLTKLFPQTKFHVSASCFVPKPWTVFQWHPMEEEASLRRRILLLRNGITSLRRTSLTTESPRLAIIQGVLARGNRELGRFLMSALDSGGNYRKALRSTRVDIASLLHRTRTRDEILPWDHIDVGLNKDRLWFEYEKALA